MKTTLQTEYQKHWIWNARHQGKTAIRYTKEQRVNTWGKVEVFPPSPRIAQDAARNAASCYFRAFPDMRETPSTNGWIALTNK